jgi:hypothetical protein
MHTAHDGPRNRNRWRIAAWGTAAVLLLLPLLAMQFTNEVGWDAFDFAVAAILVGTVGLAFQLALKMTRNRAYRAAVGVALAAAFTMVWANLAVGIIGSEDNPANRMVWAVLAVGLAGAALARFRPNGMARAMAVVAVAQVSVAGIALVAGAGSAGTITTASVVFTTLWLLSAWLFRNSAQQQASAGAAP